jgi:hypothetical protein
MRSFLLFCLLLSSAASSIAHPGIAIVKDKKGNIYYTDLSRIWKITADGKRSAVVNNVHSHELHMDTSNTLYGEHLWYNGEHLNTWGHYTWRLAQDGKFDSVIKPTEGFLTDYSFVRDDAGNMYWVQRFTVSKFKKRTVSGEVITLAEGKFKNVLWMHATNNGVIFFADKQDLYKLENGKFSLLAKDIHRSGDHDIYGIWTDKTGNIYVAVRGAQVVKKITADGRVSVFAHSPGNWNPDSGLFDDAGNLWLLESNIVNEVRVRKISRQEMAAATPAFSQYAGKWLPLILIAVLLISFVLFVFYIRRKGLNVAGFKSLKRFGALSI